MQTVQGKFKAVCDAKPFVDFAQVVLDHLFGGFQLKCNFLVALAFHNASDDHRLFWERVAAVGAELGAKFIGHGRLR